MIRRDWGFLILFLSCNLSPLLPSNASEVSDKPNIDAMAFLKADCFNMGSEEELLHTITSGKAPVHDDKFNASFLVKEFKTTLNEVGVVDYFCAIHTAIMCGAIVIEEK